MTLNSLQSALLLSRYANALAEQGLTLELVTDFDVVASIAAETGRTFQMPTFSVDRADHTTESAFWLFLRREEDYIAGAAAIFQNTGRESLASYLERTANRQFPNPNGRTIERVAEPIRNEVFGRLAYIGELHFKEGERGRRGDRLEPFMRALQLLAHSKWDFDWIYAFIPDQHMMARLDLVYGFSRHIKNGQTWREPSPDVRSSSEWFVSSSRSEVEHLFFEDALRFDIL